MISVLKNNSTKIEKNKYIDFMNIEGGEFAVLSEFINSGFY